jgi:hypothetical protein
VVLTVAAAELEPPVSEGLVELPVNRAFSGDAAGLVYLAFSGRRASAASDMGAATTTTGTGAGVGTGPGVGEGCVYVVGRTVAGVAQMAVIVEAGCWGENVLNPPLSAVGAPPV